MFWRAYWALASDRPPDTVRRDGKQQVTVMHYLPWSSVQRWAAAHDLDSEATEALHYHVRAMDIAYMAAKGHTAAIPGPQSQEEQVDGHPEGIRQPHKATRR